MAILCVDWRDADRADLAAIYASEINRWVTTLGWETAASWDHIELGRRLGTVPGLLALDADGAVAGWSFYILHQGVLQIGGFFAVSELATTALLDAILASEAAAAAQSVTVFVFSDAPGLSGALARRGLAVGDYQYRMRSLLDQQPEHHDDAAHPDTLDGSDLSPDHAGRRADECGVECSVSAVLRRWRASDLEPVTTLLGRAYPGADGVRPFASRGTLDQWREYAAQLVGAAGCGTMMPHACYIVPGGPNRVSGVVLVTRLAAATAHIAQLAVDPQAQRQGLGRVLVEAGCVSARDAGCDRITLLVDARNAPAQRLYAACGFNVVARFVAAGTSQPVRLSSVATRGGAATVRR